MIGYLSSSDVKTRQKVWSCKIFKTIGGALKLESLLPTTEVFNENVARAHLQVASLFGDTREELIHQR